MGLFDQLFTGEWNENSSCGFNEKCKVVKTTISNVCAPLRAVHGENIYQSCVSMANSSTPPKGPEDVFCVNPVGAWENYGFVCAGYTPPEAPAAAGEIQLGNQKVNILYIAAAVIFIIILYIIYKKFL